MTFNESNYQLILNYFILLEVFKMDYEKVNNFYLKYFDILNQKFLNCIFLINDVNDKKVFKKINNDILTRAKEILNLNKENILFIYEYEFLWNKKINSTPFVYFFKGNISLLDKCTFIIEQDIDNKSDFFCEISNNIISNKNNILSLFKKNNWSLLENQMLSKNFFNVIGISNLPLGYCSNSRQQSLYDYIFENGLMISYVANMNYVCAKNRNLDCIISGLFSDVFIFIDSNNLNNFIESFKILEKTKRSDYIIRYSLDNKNDDLYKNIKLEFIDSIIEFETKNEIFFHIRNSIRVS